MRGQNVSTYADDPDSIEDKDAFLRSCVEVDKDELTEEMTRIPAAIAYWNKQYADATRTHAIAKLNYDRAWAQLYVTLKAEHEGKRGMTVDALKSACDSDPDLYDLQLEMITLDAERLRLRGITDAIIAKKEMLQSIGARIREEMRGDPMLRNNALTG